MAVLSVGTEFPHFSALEVAITDYEAANFVQFYHRDLRSVLAATKQNTRRYNMEIRFSELTFSCIHGGKKFKSKSKGA